MSPSYRLQLLTHVVSPTELAAIWPPYMCRYLTILVYASDISIDFPKAVTS